MTKIELLQYLVYAQYALVALSVVVVAARVLTPHALRADIGRYFRVLLHLPHIEA
jgi:hypothetical protein